MQIQPLEKNWSLCILEYGEKSPLQNHGAFELAVDSESKRIFGSEAFIRTMGLNSIEAACRSYINKI